MQSFLTQGIMKMHNFVDYPKNKANLKPIKANYPQQGGWGHKVAEFLLAGI